MLVLYRSVSGTHSIASDILSTTSDAAGSQAGGGGGAGGGAGAQPGSPHDSASTDDLVEDAELVTNVVKTSGATRDTLTMGGGIVIGVPRSTHDADALSQSLHAAASLAGDAAALLAGGPGEVGKDGDPFGGATTATSPIALRRPAQAEAPLSSQRAAMAAAIKSNPVLARTPLGRRPSAEPLLLSVAHERRHSGSSLQRTESGQSTDSNQLARHASVGSLPLHERRDSTGSRASLRGGEGRAPGLRIRPHSAAATPTTGRRPATPQRLPQLHGAPAAPTIVDAHAHILSSATQGTSYINAHCDRTR